MTTVVGPGRFWMYRCETLGGAARRVRGPIVSLDGFQVIEAWADGIVVCGHHLAGSVAVTDGHGEAVARAGGRDEIHGGNRRQRPRGRSAVDIADGHPRAQPRLQRRQRGGHEGGDHLRRSMPAGHRSVRRSRAYHGHGPDPGAVDGQDGVLIAQQHDRSLGRL